MTYHLQAPYLVVVVGSLHAEGEARKGASSDVHEATFPVYEHSEPQSCEPVCRPKSYPLFESIKETLEARPIISHFPKQLLSH